MDGLRDPGDQFSRSEVKNSETYAKREICLHSFVTSPLVSINGNFHAQAALTLSKNPPLCTDTLLTARTGVDGHFGEEMKSLFYQQSNHVVLMTSTLSTDLTLLIRLCGYRYLSSWLLWVSGSGSSLRGLSG
jgi:hypothetical protein